MWWNCHCHAFVAGSLFFFSSSALISVGVFLRFLHAVPTIVPMAHLQQIKIVIVLSADALFASIYLAILIYSLFETVFFFPFRKKKKKNPASKWQIDKREKIARGPSHHDSWHTKGFPFIIFLRNDWVGYDSSKHISSGLCFYYFSINTKWSNYFDESEMPIDIKSRAPQPTNNALITIIIAMDGV